MTIHNGALETDYVHYRPRS